MKKRQGFALAFPACRFNEQLLLFCVVMFLDYAKGGHECFARCSTRRGVSSDIANMMPRLRVEAKSSPAK
ncbi:hypothetical protein GGE68_004856 [Rhizobium leguminosarum]|uniref:hypothetical protein n=1 Tax=Rhizobium leguminosarum TaxID=384 RepID=UPI00161E0748|nr:hypothetical protein [Rhizobium leguminosarum]MBB5666624.1 hypothetical protein [Rhizobium leguminosarum]